MTDYAPLVIDRGDTEIAVAGDWHGDVRWATKIIRQLGEAGVRTILHVGDFGFFRGKHYETYLNEVESVCAEFDIKIAITDGNHEDHHWRLELAAAGDGSPMPIREHLWILPRGYRWTHAGRTFLSLGGAPSINYNVARQGFDWFEEEILTAEEAAAAGRAGHAEVMLSHDAPSPASRRVEHIRATNPYGFSQERLSYASSGAYTLNQAYEAVRPDLLFHGHYHVHDDITLPDGRRIQALNMNGGAGNAAILDLDDLSVRQWFWQPPTPKKQALSWAEQYTTPTP
jgi:hypothetical protein